MVKIIIRKGDITRTNVDAIVNAANNRLWMGGGVAGAIKEAGGKAIEDEAVKRGPIPIGEAITTRAGILNTRYVIHAAVMGQDLKTNADMIQQATRSSLRCAEEMSIDSVAFPALGTGVGGFSVAECARIMLNEVNEHISGKTCLEKVVFILYDNTAYRTFRREMAKIEKPEKILF